MIQTMWRVIGKPTFLLAAIMALGLSACGRKGPLEPPPGASMVQDENGQSESNAEAPREKRSFFLDFLL